jgi:hypothetical protein
MSRESKEIREIMGDIEQIMESYVFGKKPQQVIPEAGNDINSSGEIPPATPEETNNVGSENSGQGNSTNIDKDVVNIRRISLELLSKINPLSSPEESKTMKSIWDSCEKFLYKDKQPKEQNNNI